MFKSTIIDLGFGEVEIVNQIDLSNEVSECQHVNVLHCKYRASRNMPVPLETWTHPSPENDTVMIIEHLNGADKRW